MDILAAEKELVKVYNEGVDMRLKYGGSTIQSPTFPTASLKSQYDSLIKRYRELEVIVGKDKALSLTNPKHVSAYGYSNFAKAGIGAGAIIVIAAIAYFVMKKKG